jgi:hypothetical protein
MRNKALGIPSKPNSSVSEQEQSSFGKENKKGRKSSISSPRKATSGEMVRVSGNNTPMKAKTVSSKKEDADVAVEINITSTQNIQVRTPLCAIVSLQIFKFIASFFDNVFM